MKENKCNGTKYKPEDESKNNKGNKQGHGENIKLMRDKIKWKDKHIREN